jgi:hypothetical protein
MAGTKLLDYRECTTCTYLPFFRERAWLVESPRPEETKPEFDRMKGEKKSKCPSYYVPQKREEGRAESGPREKKKQGCCPSGLCTSLGFPGSSSCTQPPRAFCRGWRALFGLGAGGVFCRVCLARAIPSCAFSDLGGPEEGSGDGCLEELDAVEGVDVDETGLTGEERAR